VGTWASLDEAVADLRVFMNDGPLDRFVPHKRLYGVRDGVNMTFFTFEGRIVNKGADQVASPSVTVMFNDAPLASSQVTVTDFNQGLITLATPAPPNTNVDARYFYQRFLDAELQTALETVAGEFGEVNDVTAIADGLRLAVLNFAAHVSYQKLALQWADRVSSKFVLEESPVQNEALNHTNLFRQSARDFLAQGQQLRTGYYQRHGRRNVPAFGVVKQVPPTYGPRR